jgi:hypothetical protein
MAFIGRRMRNRYLRTERRERSTTLEMRNLSVVYQAPYYYMIFTANQDGNRFLAWASSTDGKNWTKQGLLVPQSMIPAWAAQLMCDPTIMPTGNNDGTYYVWFGGGTKANAAQGVHGQIGRLKVKLGTAT